MKSKAENNWFEIWFDSPYYHILYGNRDFTEADDFVQLLVKKLNLPLGAAVLDLACGKGRHALSMNKLGLNVLGVDLAAESIRQAKELENSDLHFQVHDMRHVLENKQFACVFNLFTSFGYFDSDEDNLLVLQSIHKMLIENGTLVIDFMNAHKVVKNLVEHEQKNCGKYQFEISRYYDGKHIFKEIKLIDQGESHFFQERVQALDLAQFKILLEQAGFELEQNWGSYQLEKFDLNHSDRLILIARKK